jgi:hypothetical protein
MISKAFYANREKEAAFILFPLFFILDTRSFFFPTTGRGPKRREYFRSPIHPLSCTKSWHMTLLRDPSRLPPTNQALFEHFSLPFARLSHHHRSRRRHHHHHKAVAAWC